MMLRQHKSGKILSAVFHGKFELYYAKEDLIKNLNFPHCRTSRVVMEMENKREPKLISKEIEEILEGN